MSATEVDGTAVSSAIGLSGICEIPGSPDLSLMALALGAKGEGTTEIRRCSTRPDVALFIAILERLGVAVDRTDRVCTVTGADLAEASDPVDAGGSAMSLACLMGLFAGSEARWKIGGMAELGTVAASLGAALQEWGGRVSIPVDGGFPIEVGGRPVKAGTVRIGAPDPFVKCGVLLAGLEADGETVLIQDTAGDDDLEHLFKAASVPFEKTKTPGVSGHRMSLNGPHRVSGVMHDLPGDPDAALYLLGAAALFRRSELTLNGVGNDFKTRRALELLRRFDVSCRIDVTRSESRFPTRSIHVKGSELRRTRIAGELSALFLSELPFLAVMGTRAYGETVIRDAERLREGPVDVLALTAENLRRMNAKVGEMPDGLVIQGGQPLQGAELDAGGVAHLAMALQIAAHTAEGSSTIANTGSLRTHFGQVLGQLSSVIVERKR